MRANSVSPHQHEGEIRGRAPVGIGQYSSKRDVTQGWTVGNPN